METNRFNQIDDYLQERLTNMEAKAFEEEMAANKDLYRQVELCRELKEAILEEDVNMLRQKLTEVSREVIPTKRMLSTMPLKMVATVAIFVVASFFIWRSYSSPEHLFSNNYSRFEVPGLTRGAYVSSDGLQSQIIELYRQGKMQEVIPQLEKYTQQRHDEAVAKLMLSSAYLENNMAPKAEKLLKDLANQVDDGMYSETAQWYLCLSYLMQEKYKEAFIASSKIKAQGGKYAESARAINDRLMSYLN